MCVCERGILDVTQLRITNEIHCFRKILPLTNKRWDPDSGSLWSKSILIDSARSENMANCSRGSSCSPAELVPPLSVLAGDWLKPSNIVIIFLHGHLLKTTSNKITLLLKCLCNEESNSVLWPRLVLLDALNFMVPSVF